jgi:hypothetical protein
MIAADEDVEGACMLGVVDRGSNECGVFGASGRKIVNENFLGASV